jgi:hypothetical protein
MILFIGRKGAMRENKGGGSKRLLFVDLLRFLAIFLMFWDHGLKLFYNFKTESLWEKILTEFAVRILRINTLSSALFLFLVGFSLVISFYRRRGGSKLTWIFRKWQRGLVLIFLSYFLFFFKFGLERVDALATSGILQLIGLILILGSLLFGLKRRLRVTFVLVLNYLVLLTDFALRTKGIEIPLLNVYIFPILPHLSYALGGLLVAEGWFFWVAEGSRKKYLRRLFWGSLVGILVLLTSAGFNPFLIFELTYIIGGFWHPSIVLVFFNTLIICFLTAIVARVERKLSLGRFWQRIGRLGKVALTIYFWHVFLGWGVAKYILREARFGAWAPILAVGAFCFLALGVAKIKQKRIIPKTIC